MRTFAIIFGLIGVFLVPVSIVYGLMTQFHDWAGFPALVVTALMSFFICGFLLFTDKKHPNQPSENLDGEIVDAAGAYGFYSPWSWWPLLIGFLCALAVMGLAIAPWVFLIIVPIAIAALVGWVYEYNRGDHAH